MKPNERSANLDAPLAKRNQRLKKRQHGWRTPKRAYSIKLSATLAKFS